MKNSLSECKKCLSPRIFTKLSFNLEKFKKSLDKAEDLWYDS